MSKEKLDKNMQKHEIEEILQKKGDFVQIDYLSELLEQNPPLEIKQFAYEKLAELFGKKGLYSEAGKMYENRALSSVKFKEIITDYMKASKVYLKGGEFDRAEKAMKKAMAEASESEKKQIYEEFKNYLKEQGEQYEKIKKRKNAATVYEKLMEINLSDEERKEIKEKLLKIYENLGRVQDYFSLEKK